MNTKHNNSNPLVYEIGKNKSQTSMDWGDFLCSRADPDRLFFIQALSCSSEQLQCWLQTIDANPLIMERCIDSDAVSGVFCYEQMFVLQLPVTERWESSQYLKITLICLHNTLIIVSEKHLFSRDCFLPEELLPTVCFQTNITSMLYVLLDGLVDHSSDLMMQIRRSVDYLEQDMMEEASFGKQLLVYNRNLAHFEIALEAKHRTLTALLSANTSLIDLDNIRSSLRDVVAHIEHSQRYVERIEDRLSELHRHMTLLLQEKTNQRLRILTILSAIFMPLTLVAGIYGMNFRSMPELDWKYGYPFALLVMLGIATGLLIYFVRKGWFR
jgi:magnesium transporter